MPRAPQAETVCTGLIDKLNSIRFLPTGQARDLALDQIAFASQRLRSADPSGFLGVQGMVAALKLDHDGIADIETRLAESFPDDIQEHYNLVRSYLVIGALEDARRILIDGRERFDVVAFHPHWRAYTLLLAGDIEESSNAFMLADERALPPPAFHYTMSVAPLIPRFRDTEVTSWQLSETLKAVVFHLRDLGWPTPGITLEAPSFAAEDAVPAAIIGAEIECEFDRLLDIEDELSSRLISSGAAAAIDGRISCFVSTNCDHANADIAG